jgi:hypothetical protein
MLNLILVCLGFPPCPPLPLPACIALATWGTADTPRLPKRITAHGGAVTRPVVIRKARDLCEIGA